MGFIGATCDCGEWGAMNKTTRNCVPTTCLRPDLTCKDLCEKNLLQRDSRCCQGWNTANCSAAPPADSYCSPGSPKGPDGQCKNACRTKEAGFVCKHGCRSTDKAYECTCPSISYTVSCTVEQKQTCRPTEDCRVQKGTVLCECPWNQHLVGGHVHK
ncbi:hypothetical protein MRX96_022404 [Rhipicephalus microplus]